MASKPEVLIARIPIFHLFVAVLTKRQQVGSGPAGLALALSLLKNGIPVRIIEKDEQHHHGERGPGIMVGG
jgi:ribulose 1,5-bisphosphate synthetase/thiazole synthase